MTALMLSVMITLPFSFDHATYMEGIERNNYQPNDWSGTGFTRGECEPEEGYAFPYDSGCNEGYNNYKRFTQRWNLCTTMLSSSLLIICLIYASMAHTSFRDHAGRNSAVLLEAWWRPARWLALYAVLTCILGIVFCFMCILPLLALMMPRMVDVEPFTMPFPPWILLPDRLGQVDVVQQYTVYFGIFGAMPIAWSAGSLSYGLYRKSKAYLKLQYEEEESQGQQQFVANASGATVVPTVGDDDDDETSGGAASGTGTRSIEELITTVTAGKAGVTPAQRTFAIKMITSLGWKTEADFQEVFYFIDWARMMPAFPALVELHLKKHFTVELNVKRFS